MTRAITLRKPETDSALLQEALSPRDFFHYWYCSVKASCRSSHLFLLAWEDVTAFSFVSLQQHVAISSTEFACLIIVSVLAHRDARKSFNCSRARYRCEILFFSSPRISAYLAIVRINAKAWFQPLCTADHDFDPGRKTHV